MVLNSLLYLCELQKKCDNPYKDLINKLYDHISAIHVLSTGYLVII